MTRCHKCHTVHLDAGYRNYAVALVPKTPPPCRTWGYRVTFPTGAEVADTGFGSFAEAFREAMVFIDLTKKAQK